MKRAFSTLACMEYSYIEILSVAKKANMKGVEIRLDSDGKICGLNMDELAECKKAFALQRIEITDLGTGVTLCDYESDKIQDAKEKVVMASLVGAKGIRIMLGDFRKYYSDPVYSCYEGIVRALQELCLYAWNWGIEIWVETHNDFSTGKVLRKLIEDVNKENLKIVWDIVHPIEAGETPEETLRYLGDRLAHVHIKDGIKSNDHNAVDYIYTWLGQGELPISRILSMLKKAGYEGYLSLEWEAVWRQEIRHIYESVEDLLRDYNQFMDWAELNGSHS